MLPCPKIVRGQQQLTPEQEAYAREFARERIAAMLSTAPIDEQEAEKHLRAAYRAVWLRPPAQISWFDSPHSIVRHVVSCYTANYILPSWVRTSVEARVQFDQEAKMKARIHKKGIGYDVLSCVLSSMGANVWEKSVLSSMGVSVWERRKYSLHIKAYLEGWQWVPMRDNVVVRVSSIVEDSVRASVRASRPYVETRLSSCVPNSQDKTMERLWDKAGDIMRDCVRAYSSGPLFASYQFFHEMLQENKLIHLARLNEMVSGYRLGARQALLVRKPTFLERDAQGRLHSATGPCIEYRDGWKVYAWHGVPVSEKLIMHPEQVERREWFQEPNVEVRRAIQECLGSERFVETVGGKQVDTGRRGRLIEIDLGTSDPERVAHYVQVQDSSTERQYYLRVPPWITTVDEAIAWTFGLSARGYQPGQEA